MFSHFITITIVVLVVSIVSSPTSPQATQAKYHARLVSFGRLVATLGTANSHLEPWNCQPTPPGGLGCPVPGIRIPGIRLRRGDSPAAPRNNSKDLRGNFPVLCVNNCPSYNLAPIICSLLSAITWAEVTDALKWKTREMLHLRHSSSSIRAIVSRFPISDLIDDLQYTLNYISS